MVVRHPYSPSLCIVSNTIDFYYYYDKIHLNYLNITVSGYQPKNIFPQGENKMLNKIHFNSFRSKKLTMLASLALAGVMILAACQSAVVLPVPALISTQEPAAVASEAPAVTKEPAAVPAVIPSVKVNDQAIENGSLKIASAVSDGQGWLVIHSQVDGKPGPILGYTALVVGDNQDVVVNIDSSKATETLYAMLHTDAGILGVFEFPDGPDAPVFLDGVMVNPPFIISSGLVPSAIVLLGGNETLGAFLTGSNGMTLYIFTKDKPFDESECYEQCAVNWPPLLVDQGQTLTAGVGVTGQLGTIQRKDGTLQVTYNGWPVYYWINDKASGDATGQGVNNAWFVATSLGQITPLAIQATPASSSYDDSGKENGKDDSGY
jgi:predicted lipoprotein with Yx(FWY)xxD motif